MRSIVAFYRRNPLVLVIAVLVGAGLSLMTAAAGSGGIVGPIILAVVVGVLVGLGVAAARGRDAGDRS